jgi:hypothetical protein
VSRVLRGVACFALVAVPLAAQQPSDSTPPRIRARIDSVPVQGGLYNRPFLASMGRTAIGGYLEGNTNYFREDGISDGFSTELRRFNIFLFSSIGSRIRIISELEFEHGTEEISSRRRCSISR